MDVELAERDVIRTAADRLGDLTGGAGRIGFEPAQLTVERHAILAEAHAGLVPAPGLVERLRVVKDADELAAVRASAALIEPVYQLLAGEGLMGRTEAEVAWHVRELFHEGGADGLAFETIVASHERGAQPHAHPGEDVIGPDTLITIDLGCMLAGYASDCTRTFATGTPPAVLTDLYAICLEAQLAAMDAVRPGIPRRRCRRRRPLDHRGGRPRRAASAIPPATASASRSTRRRGSERRRLQPWSRAWSSQWSRGSTCPA